MICISKIDSIKKEEIKSIAILHKVAFPKFFLTQLGIPFLYSLYSGYVKDKKSGILVARDNNRIIGFIAYSFDYPGFYKGLIKNHIIRFMFCSLFAVIRHPSFIKRLFGALKKSEEVTRKEKYVELASICVHKSMLN